MADASQTAWEKIGSIIKIKTKELSSNIDLSGIKLPGVSADVEVGSGTKNIVYAALIMFAIWLYSKKRR